MTSNSKFKVDNFLKFLYEDLKIFIALVIIISFFSFFAADYFQHKNYQYLVKINLNSAYESSVVKDNKTFNFLLSSFHKKLKSFNFETNTHFENNFILQNKHLSPFINTEVRRNGDLITFRLISNDQIDDKKLKIFLNDLVEISIFDGIKKLLFSLEKEISNIDDSISKIINSLKLQLEFAKTIYNKDNPSSTVIPKLDTDLGFNKSAVNLYSLSDEELNIAIFRIEKLISAYEKTEKSKFFLNDLYLKYENLVNEREYLESLKSKIDLIQLIKSVKRTELSFNRHIALIFSVVLFSLFFEFLRFIYKK